MRHKLVGWVAALRLRSLRQAQGERGARSFALSLSKGERGAGNPTEAGRQAVGLRFPQPNLPYWDPQAHVGEARDDG